MNYDIEYWTNAADDAFTNTMTVSAALGVRLIVASNHDNPQAPAIGRFALSPTAPQVDPLLQAVSAPEFFALKNPSGVMPGEVVRRITVHLDGRPEFERHVAEGKAPDAAFASTEQLLLGLMRETRRHPERALEIYMSIAPASAREGSDAAVATLSLRNPGPLPVAIPGPDRWASTGVVLSITARRTDVPLADMRDQHQTLVELGSGALTQTPVATGSSLIVLAPGATSVFQFRVVLPLDRGLYDAWGAFATPLLDEHGSSILRGECTSAKQALKRD